mmetsp:Transcript_109369/g.199248  ORF Transcript_109369/g.199248 Transcript_109369/m.199248 type:complete len:103 (-) Transcript_109369:3-311(-)
MYQEERLADVSLLHELLPWLPGLPGEVVSDFWQQRPRQLGAEERYGAQKGDDLLKIIALPRALATDTALNEATPASVAAHAASKAGEEPICLPTASYCFFLA